MTELMNGRLSEHDSLEQLAAARESLVFDEAGNSIETRSSKGLGAVETFLEALEGVADAFDIEPASRDYRSAFQEHFNDMRPQRDYSITVLEACLSLRRSGAIWANGHKFELSPEAETACLSLHEEWHELLTRLDQILPISLEDAREVRPDLRVLLSSFDGKWAIFEHCYIIEIVKVQHRAKGLVCKAIEVEDVVTGLESKADIDIEDSAEYQLHVRALVACTARLNVAANLQRKTFDELTVDIRENAVALLRMCAIDADTPLQAARAIARQVVQSFEDVRDCLRSMQHKIDQINPQLCQNEELVASLMRWEEAWIVGVRYIQTRPVLGALCKMIPRLLRATELSSTFSQMCSSFDAELFLVLPRIVWLSYLDSPESFTGLISNLLPHRFVHVAAHGLPQRRAGDAQLQRLRRQQSQPALGACETPEELAVLGSDVALRVLQEKFSKVKQALQAACPPDALPLQAFAWPLMVQSAIKPGDHTQFEVLDPASRAEAVAAVDELMHELESWSMELQRHCPEDWNECINVLIQCLFDEQSKKT
mmetsp:Transcript_10922/g.26238  ORF Transcript_10922/g.26238 Transcript_10922/m.26238 type:complete len:540 (+) Transcript_10922:52-1671(+)